MTGTQQTGAAGPEATLAPALEGGEVTALEEGNTAGRPPASLWLREAELRPQQSYPGMGWRRPTELPASLECPLSASCNGVAPRRTHLWGSGNGASGT